MTDIAYGAPLGVFLNFRGRVGIWTGETPPTTYGDDVNFEVLDVTAPALDSIYLTSMMHGNLGAALDSQNVPNGKVATIKIEATTFTPRMIEMITGGAVSMIDQTGAAVADEVVTTALGEWVQLANRGIEPDAVATPIALVTSSDAAVADTTYVVDLELGQIKATDAAAVGVGMKLSYHTRTQAMEDYSGGMAKSTYCHITGVAYDRVSGKVGTLDIWRANLSSGGKFSPIGKEYLKGMLDGALVMPPTGILIAGKARTAPWNWERRRA